MNWLKNTPATLTLAAVLLTGCSFAGRKDHIADKDYPNIAVIEGLRKDLVFSTPMITDLAGQPMAVTVGVRNATFDVDKHIQYKFEFYDRQGKLVQPEQQWQYRVLPQRAQVQLTGSALDASASTWRLVVRPAR